MLNLNDYSFDEEINFNLIRARKNQACELIWCNSTFVNIAGQEIDAIIGKTDYDFVWNEYADKYLQHEQECLNGNETTAFIPIKNHQGENFFFMHKKFAVYDEYDKFQYLECISLEIIDPVIINQSNILLKNNPHDSLRYGRDNSLSQKEQLCLLYLIYGKSTDSIALLMDISKKTVEFYLEKLRMKFNCNTKAELVDAAIGLGYMQLIPSINTLEKLTNAIK